MEGEVKQDIDVDKIIEQLKEFVILNSNDEKDGDNNDIIKVLDNFLNATQSSFEENSKFTIEDVNVFITLLTHKSNVIVTKATKTIAELARTKDGREKCSQNELVKLLINLLKEDDIDLITQVCRALGNICYENASASKMVKENDGLSLILSVLKKSVYMKDEEGAGFLRYVAAGFLLNSQTDQSEAIDQKELEQNLIPIICDVLEIDGVTGGNSAMHALLTLEALNESGHQFLNERLAKVLVDILDVDISTELSELCLTLLQGQAEHGETKLLLAKTGVCELLLKLLEKHVAECMDEESRVILKDACDFVVFIMTGEESMNLLYADGKGTVYVKLVEWLEMDNCDEDLRLTAVLAMGNFGTSDAHCQQMAANGIHKHLFRLLRANRDTDGNIRLQYGLLSAIRNLVIPPSNKKIMLADGVIDVVYPMIEIQAFPVAFKLLGILRIVIDGQEEAATLLGMRDGLLSRAVEWCNNDLHLGIQAEASRLIAWLVINSRNEELICSIINHGAIPNLVKMMSVPQALMQNEALMSLTIMSTIALDQCVKPLLCSNIVTALGTFVTVSGSYLELPIVENALTFITTIIKSDTVRDDLKESQLLLALKKCEKEIWTDSMKQKLKTISKSLSN
ncbi:hypothetical protein PV327_000711 [Microctonus hyperodae]|uniref:Rap1 GTPase-GDP dissociation stimulator 1-B n=1 Tax=Microctonus hyperodae TaxID=165561 RepID=A0AA39G784_MICHY|nr:hypothetical protein PV327_000711 [Microctonus hyperodae]